MAGLVDVARVLGLKGINTLKLRETLEQQGFVEKNSSASDTEQHWRHALGEVAYFTCPVSRQPSGFPRPPGVS
jgi:hypothetical protein